MNTSIIYVFTQARGQDETLWSLIHCSMILQPNVKNCLGWICFVTKLHSTSAAIITLVYRCTQVMLDVNFKFNMFKCQEAPAPHALTS